MEEIVLVIHLLLALSLIATVLLQRSEGGGLGIGGGSGGGLISVRGTANLLTRTTSILAGLFMVTSLVLAILAGAHSTPTSIMDQPQAPSAPPPAQAPSVPLSR